ncbi:hypothetical protein EVAR_75263_1 [Eumeta japonica]|uniref:Uncharacterized protein n=1 Tax=Eumeta variegata TaxID=151549 RepID=A0A4C1V944_EUMVA|nr:hypothetical protein EVAR_75263_1 [Eumeta japonica]
MRTIIKNDNVITTITAHINYLEKPSVTHRMFMRRHNNARNVMPISINFLLLATIPEIRVLLRNHGLNDIEPGQTAKLIPRRDGSYVVREWQYYLRIIKECLQESTRPHN